MECNSIDCKAVQELIMKFTSDEVSAEELERVKVHLDRCGGCRTERDIIASLLDKLKNYEGQYDCMPKDGCRERMLDNIRKQVNSLD